MRLITLYLGLLCLALPTWADVLCNGTDTDISMNVAVSTFISASTGTLTVWYRPVGTADSLGPDCFGGEYLLGDASNGGFVGLYRNGDLAGTDRVCAMNWDGSNAELAAPYTVGTWTHLAWVHGGGTLAFYKDGLLVGSTASGDTEDITRTLRLCAGGVTSVAYGEGHFAEARANSTALSAQVIAALAGSRLRYAWSAGDTGYWPLDGCGDGAACVAGLLDASGNGSHLVPSATTGAASSFLSYPWGVD